MGLLRSIVTLPVSGPFNTALWVAAQIARQADSERNSPAALRQALRLAECQMLAQEITEEDYEAIEEDLLLRLREAQT
ncbi:MAG: gas vesicle protein GvpG [Pseudomonadota bacterium]